MTLLLQELVSFQERIYQKDPMRAKAKRRLVMGLREVTKHMKLNKIKCVIISPNCEKIQSKGINDYLWWPPSLNSFGLVLCFNTESFLFLFAYAVFYSAGHWGVFKELCAEYHVHAGAFLSPFPPAAPFTPREATAEECRMILCGAEPADGAGVVGRRPEQMSWHAHTLCIFFLHRRRDCNLAHT